MPCEIPVLVVSLPAKMKSSKKFEYSVFVEPLSVDLGVNES